MFQPSLNRIGLLVFAVALTTGMLSSCKNEPKEEVVVEETPATRERTGPIIPFEVRDQSDNPIPFYRVFESFEEGSSGSVFQFQHTFASIAFEPGARYKITADGFHPLDFEFTGRDGIKRLVFYMNHAGNEKNTALISGMVQKRDMRPFTKTEVSTLDDLSANSAAEGRYVLTGFTLPEGQPLPLTYQWTDENGKKGQAGLLFRNSVMDTVRVDLVLDVDLPASEMNLPLN